MALTLLEANKLNDGNVKRTAIIEMFAQNSDLLRVLPFMDIPGGSMTYNKESKLPGVGFRGYNEYYTESLGVINPETEVLRISGGWIDVDRAMIKTRGSQVRSEQEAMKVKAMALAIASKMINGDSEVNPREFDGLRKRINGDQLVSANLTAPAANSALSLEALDDAIDRVEHPTHLLMSKQLRNKLTTASRTMTVAGDIDYTIDEFGQRVTLYNGIPILIADYDETGTRLLQFNEVGPGGGVNSQSLYVLSIGDGKVTGLQNGPMEVNDLGLVPGTPTYRTDVEWIVGFAVMHGRSCARLWGIQNAAITQ
jgi:hypothetical protein